jgi:predicted nuclease with RNAse H fold
MRTLGIDLASDPKKTAYCVLEWAGGTAEVRQLCVGEEGGPLADDECLFELYRHADATGIDCPFGWPTAFVAFLCSTSRPTGELLPAWSDVHRDELRFRATDVRVHKVTGRWPLSVSSGLIGVPAFRCQGLLTRMRVVDRSGDGRVYEVYPAAALERWGFPSTGYKKGKGTLQRKELVRHLQKKARWLHLSDDQRRMVVGSDDALDALIAALNARAARLGLTLKPEPHEQRDAIREGWIAVPEKDSLENLLGPGVPAP